MGEHRLGKGSQRPRRGERRIVCQQVAAVFQLAPDVLFCQRIRHGAGRDARGREVCGQRQRSGREAADARRLEQRFRRGAVCPHGGAQCRALFRHVLDAVFHRRHHGIGRAGGAEQLHRLFRRRPPGGAAAQQRPLGEGGHGLVRAVYPQIGKSARIRGGAGCVEGHERPVRAVYQERRLVRVADAAQGGKIAHPAVIAGRGQEHRRAFMPAQRPLHACGRGGQPRALVFFIFNDDGRNAQQRAGVIGALVRVPRQQQRLCARSAHHGVHARRGAVGEDAGKTGAEDGGDVFLRGGDDAAGVFERVGKGKFGDVEGGGKTKGEAKPVPFMPRHMQPPRGRRRVAAQGAADVQFHIRRSFPPATQAG